MNRLFFIAVWCAILMASCSPKSQQLAERNVQTTITPDIQNNAEQHEQVTPEKENGNAPESTLDTAFPSDSLNSHVQQPPALPQEQENALCVSCCRHC